MKLTLTGLTKQFNTLRGTVTPVRQMDLEVQDREFFVLLGPSGCGKSTLLNLVAGLERPSAGTIRIGERLVADPSQDLFLGPRERNIAMVFQSYALYPHMDVYGNIAFPLRIGGEKNKNRIRSAVEEAAATLGIDNLLQAKPGELSGGQRQRVAIARAIVRKPTLFLMDEPLSNLDAQLRSTTRAELKKLQRKLGITTLYVTHDQQEAMTLGDRVAVLRNGRFEQIGAPMDLFRNPQTPFVGRFVGSPPMNVVSAKYRRSGDILKLRLAEGPELALGLDTPFSQRLPGSEGQVEIGIRPEDVELNRDQVQPSSGAWFEARVSAFENMGRENLVFADAGTFTLSSLQPEPGYNLEERIWARLAFDKAILFAANLGD